MVCFVVAGFLLTSASRGFSATAELLVHAVREVHTSAQIYANHCSASLEIITGH